MVVRNFDLKKEVERIITLKGPFKTNIQVGKMSDIISSIIAGKKSEFEVVCAENDYAKYGSKVADILKKAGIEVSTFLIDVSSDDYANFQFDFSGKGHEVIVIGERELVVRIAQLANESNMSCHAVLLEPCFDGLISGRSYDFYGQEKPLLNTPLLQNIIVDSDILNKNVEELGSKSYLRIMSITISLIDYKLKLLSGEEKFNKADYDILRYALGLSLNLEGFNKIADVIAYSSLLIEVIFLKGQAFENSGVDVLRRALRVITKEHNKLNHFYLALEKCIKLYHAYFSNDFEGLVSAPNYSEDICDLNRLTGKNVDYYRENIKYNDKIRNIDMVKISKSEREGFVKETASLMEILPKIKKQCLKLCKEDENLDKIDYESIKRAVQLAPYFTDKWTVLTIMRDKGILQCAR